jgi:hypothetical protein
MKTVGLRAVSALVILLGAPVGVLRAQPVAEDFAAWNRVGAQGPLSAEETRAFMKALAK